MEKQNRKCREKYEKEERKRLMKLVDLAWNADPRIKAMREAEAAAKRAAKEAKKDAKIKQAIEREEA